MMNKEIKERIETINKGKVPDGYIRTKAGLMPCDWIKSKPLTTNMIFENISDKNHGNEYPVLSATQEKGVVLRNEIEKDINFNKENTNSYKLVCKGDYVISLRSFQGGIEYSNIDGLVSPAYTVIRPIIPISYGYYKEYFKTTDFIDRLNSAIYGIRDGKQIGYKDFTELVLHNPPLEEQEKIAEILSRCDIIIEKCKKEVEEYKNLKKTCLSKMFPKKGSNIPEIRFPGFTDAWEQRKVRDVANRYDNLRVPVAANLRVSGTTPYYGANGIQDYVEGYTHEGEFVLVAEDGANDLKNYPVKCVNGRIWVNNHAHVLQGKAKIADNQFLAYSINQADIESLLVGGSRAKLNAETLMDIELTLPSLPEQQEIGTYLKHLDNLITLHQRKVNAYTQMKKALTQLLLTGIVRVSKQQEILP